MPNYEQDSSELEYIISETCKWKSGLGNRPGYTTVYKGLIYLEWGKVAPKEH